MNLTPDSQIPLAMAMARRRIYRTARKTSLAGIKVTFNLILGYPGETEEDRLITFRTMSDIGRTFSTFASHPYIHTISWNSYLAAASGAWSTGAANSNRLDGDAPWSEFPSLA